MTVDDILEEILEREQENKSPGFLTPGDKGGRTNWGISEKAHPEEWKNGKVPNRARAKEIFFNEYAGPWGMLRDGKLKALIVDMTVLHGLGNAKHILREAAAADPRTIVLNEMEEKIFITTIVAHRCRFMVNIANRDASQRKNLRGWINRAVSFLA